MIKNAVRKFLQRFGYDIIKLRPAYVSGSLNKEALLAEYQWLAEYTFDNIIDIGANEGQFSEKMRTLFPAANIIAFEPIPATCEKLRLNFAGDAKFKALNAGLGDSEGILEFYQNEYSPSSSFLPMEDAHKTNFEHAVKEEKITVHIKTLDSIAANVYSSGTLLIKMDVQGYEDKIIAGGSTLLAKADMIITELSFERLYKGQPLFHEIYCSLLQLGFYYAGNIEQLRSPKNNKILQGDGIFVKQKN